MFSIVIPLYNKASYIGKCLQSVINQTLQDFEVIVINDGSSDDGADKVQKLIGELSERKIDFVEDLVYKRSNNGENATPIENTSENQIDWVKPCAKNVKIKLINQENYGVSVARNNGVQLAKFDYIVFLDADDWWDEHFLEEMKRLIEEYPDAALYGCDYFYVKNRKNKIEDKGLSSDFTIGYIDYISVYSSSFVVPINCSFVVVRKDIFISSGGFRENLKFGEDFDLWLRLALNNKVAYINKPLAFSNQDAEINNRAIGSKKLYTPEENVIFNLDTLLELESKHAKLKTLLDGLRVRALQKYHLQGKFEYRVKSELNKVDFEKQPFYFRFIYFFPKPLVKLYFKIIITGSRIKHAL
jgi:glycosyltransferase involved in cell wall biosynthesis